MIIHKKFTCHATVIRVSNKSNKLLLERFNANIIIKHINSEHPIFNYIFKGYIGYPLAFFHLFF